MPNPCQKQKIFEIFETYKTSIDIITTSEVGVSVTLDNEKNLTEIVNELKKFGVVTVDKDMVIICVVGDLVSENVGFESRLFDPNEIPLDKLSGKIEDFVREVSEKMIIKKR